MLNADDPLLNAPLDLSAYVREFSPGSDPMVAMASYFEKFKVEMPMFDTLGTPLIPPPEHVLDHLARAWLLDEDEASSRIPAGTVACPVESIECDICESVARYETWVENRRYGRDLVSLCVSCAQRHSVEATLGHGHAVYLMYFEEVPDAVRAICDEIRSASGQGSIWHDESDVRGAVEDASPDPVDGIRADLAKLTVELRSLSDALAVKESRTRDGLPAQAMLRALRAEFEEYKSAVKTIADDFKVDENGSFSLTSEVAVAYKQSITDARAIKVVLELLEAKYPGID